MNVNEHGRIPQIKENKVRFTNFLWWYL